MTTPANPDTSNSVGATDDASKGGLLNTGSDTILNGINNAIASNAEAAQTAATAAGTSASNAATSATNAAASASTASTKAGEAAADAIDTAADVVSTAADRVQTGLDRTAASNSASAAATSETNAAGSATAAAGSASSVAANAAAAAASETAAAASETAAATSETNAATSASTAATKASEAATSATNASNNAAFASSFKTAAETAKTGAETAETNAETAETNAANSATAAANSATASATSATNASNSASAASTSETNAATSETNAATSASTASTQATNASNSATSASTSASSANTAKTAAETAETNAETAETNASNSATAAANSATAGATSATNASNSASAASTSASNAATSETNAATSASTASTQATNASNSASSAATSATNASNSASAASTSASNAAASESGVASDAAAAAASKTAAAASETAAATSETNAATSASTASTQATNASTSATAAATSATASATSATASATSATASETAKTASEAARDQALAAFDNFDDKYLGEKSADPTVDNDGDPLQAGMLYFNTTDNVMKVYTGSAWVAAYVSGQGFASLSGADFTGAITAPSINLASTTLVNSILDEDNMASNSATALSTQQAIKSYVDTQVATVPVGDITAVTAGTGLSGGGTSGAVTLDIDSTVATLTGTQTLTNKTLGATSVAGNLTFTGTQTVDGRDVSVDGTKLDTIETNADVTDTTNVTAAGALMDSEVTNLAQVKAFNSSDYATAAQGTLATNALPKSGGAMTGAITTNSTFDGRNVSVDGAKLDGIEAGATTDQTASEIRALVESATDSNVFTDADHTKLNGIEAGANVTDATNVAAAGALMDSEVTNLAQVKAFDSSDYATAAQGTTADAALPRTGGAMTGAITTNSTFDGRNVSVDGAKLDGIEAGATTDQTASEIRALVESATDSNVFTDADHTKLNGIATNATAYNNSDVDTHLNTSTAASSEVLSWTGSDYDWVAQSSGADLYTANPVSATNPLVYGNNSIAIGSGANASYSNAPKNDSLAIGTSALTTGTRTLAIGYSPDALEDYATAVGNNARARKTQSTALGHNTYVDAQQGVAIGANSACYGDAAVSLGSAYTSGDHAFAAVITSNGNTYGAQANYSTAIGRNAKASFGQYTISMGYAAHASGNNAVAIGTSAVASHADSMALGSSVSSTATNQVNLAGSTQTVRISESYTLPTSDGTNGQVLTTDGSGAVSFADAGGGGASTEISILAKTASYTVVAGDAGKIISFSGGAYTATLTAAATLGSGFFCYIENNAATSQATHTVTIDGNGSETIDGRTTFIVRQGERVQLVCDGSNFRLISSFHRGIATNMRTDFFNLPQALGQESVAIGLGTIAGVGNTSNAVAIGTNAQAGSSATAIGGSTNAGSSFSTALGKNSGGGGSVTATGSGAMSLGGSYASGADSFAAAMVNNTSSYGAQGINSIAMGTRAKSLSNYGVAIGFTTIATQQSTSLGPNSSAGGTSGIRSTAVGYQVYAGGSNNTVIGSNSGARTALFGDVASSSAIGYQAISLRSGQISFGNGRVDNDGDSQYSVTTLRCKTTNNTQTVMTTDNSTATALNQINLASSVAMSFKGMVVARESAGSGTDCAAFEISGLIRQEAGGASTTVLVNSAITVIDNQPNWGLALSADTTLGGLKIQVTGASSTTIKWAAPIQCAEVYMP